MKLISMEQQQYPNKIKRNLYIMVLLFLFLGCMKFPDLGEKYRLDYNSFGDICILDTKNTVIIRGHILDYCFNDKFIIASERPRDSIPECRKENKEATLKDCDKAFKKSTFFQVWIIIKDKELVLGPFDKQTYLLKKNELDIPDKLKLTSIE